MIPGSAFELNDLMILLGLKLAEPADQADIEAIEAILDRRRTGGWSTTGPGDRTTRGLHLVRDVPSST